MNSTHNSTMPENATPVWTKLPKTGTSIFSVMSRLANECGAINLSQGFPDFEGSPELVSLVHQFMKKGHNQYAPMPGVMALREQIAAKNERLYGTSLNPETDITITAGATQAIYTAITAFIRENDEVIVFEPAYDSYVPAIQLAGGKPNNVSLEAPDFRIPWEQVKKVVNNRTRMIIFNTPHNPTGTIMHPEDFEELDRIIWNTNILLLSDEVYEHLTYDGIPHQSILNYPQLLERSLVTFSFGKTFHNTGWKTGYCIAPAYLTREFRKVHQFVTFAVNTPVQHAFAEYLKNEQNYLHLPAFFQQKRDYFLERVKDSKFTFMPAAGSYFQLLNYSNITDEKDTDFANRLTREFGVASIPISVFYNDALDQKMLRFCFAKKEETLEKAAELLCRVT